MNWRLATSASALSIAVLLFSAQALVAKEPAKPKKLARPPKWSAETLDTFFPDARTQLVGTRPNYEHLSTSATTPLPQTADSNTAAAPAGQGWSKVIDAETIETEIKRLGQEVGKGVNTPAPFKGGGYKETRRQFSELAALFAVTAEYDGDIRWKDSAAALRDAFARAGRNCKVGTDQSFQEAKQRKQDLADLIGGNRPKPSDAERKADWSQVADRPPLMQRLEIAQQTRLQKWLASKAEFSAHRDEIKHEAQLMAAIADIITHEGFEYSDDETYTQYAKELKQAASDAASTADRDNYDQTRQAVVNASKACANCHEGYRQ